MALAVVLLYVNIKLATVVVKAPVARQEVAVHTHCGLLMTLCNTLEITH